MANDREQKIRDVYEAMHKKRMEEPGIVRLTERGIARMHEMARAAVDVLDPVTRIELSGGFHAEQNPAVPTMHDIIAAPSPGGQVHHGSLSKAAVEAWAAAAEPRVTTTKTEAELKAAYAEIENLKQRIASLARIMEAMQSAAALDAVKALRP